MAAVLSGDADIGFSGSEETIYVYNGGEEDYVMIFAGLTQKDGSFLVSRKKYDNFTLGDLSGKTVLGGFVPYIAYNVRKRYIEKNPVVIEKIY